MIMKDNYIHPLLLYNIIYKLSFIQYINMYIFTFIRKYNQQYNFNNNNNNLMISYNISMKNSC